MLEHLETILEKYNSLSEELTKPEVLGDIKKTTEISKEIRDMEDVVNCYKKYKKVLEEIEDAKEMIKDPEMEEMAKEELSNLEGEKERLDGELQILLIPKDPNDSKNVIVEIRGAAGGDEANIFAGDLFRMYSKYAESRGWKIELMDSEQCEAGGFSYISFMINGDSVYSFMKYESGSHRHIQDLPDRCPSLQEHPVLSEQRLYSG